MAWPWPRTLRRLRRSQQGVSATEFALIAPVLVAGLLVPVDLGLAAYERMTMNHALRVGAQGAMEGRDPGDILAIMRASAAENFTLAGDASASEGEETLSLSVDAVCRCSDQLSTAVSCGETCPSGDRYRYLDLTADKIYDGALMPAFELTAALRVQIE